MKHISADKSVSGNNRLMLSDKSQSLMMSHVYSLLSKGTLNTTRQQ
jgi:hypothetical protein